jgi:hypothetical protein
MALIAAKLPKSVSALYHDCVCLASAAVCSEERHCRFCNESLPDWKEKMHAGSKQSTPYMRVSFNGRTHKVPVKPGEQGQKEFSVAIRKLLNLPEEQEFDVSILFLQIKAFCACCRALADPSRYCLLLSRAGHFPLSRTWLR